MSLSNQPSSTQPASSTQPLALAAVERATHLDLLRAEARTVAAIPSPVERELALGGLMSKLTAPAVLERITQDTLRYLAGFSYSPMADRSAAPIRFEPDPQTIRVVLNTTLFHLGNSDVGARGITEVLLNPAALGKMVVLYEMDFVTQKKTPEEKKEFLREIISKMTAEDATLRFVSKAFSTPIEDPKTGQLIDLPTLVRRDPETHARAAIAHAWSCRVHGVAQDDVATQLALGNGSHPIKNQILGVLGLGGERRSLNQMIANLRSEAPVPCDSGVIIGESLFFQPALDRGSYALPPAFLSAFTRGVRNVEIAVDMLPFDPSKRLPGEMHAEELARLKALAQLLNQTITVHSPIVGAFHPKTKFNSVLEDAADNVQVMKETIDVAAKMGAKTVVVHISDRENAEAIERYAEIALHAVGKKAADGSPLRVAFENYMSKTLPNGSRPYATMDQHFDAFEKVLLNFAHTVVRREENLTESLQHISVLLDSAHFNLVTKLDEDPLKAPLILFERAQQLAQRLTSDPTLGPALSRTNFDSFEFVTGILAQLHLNQNIGPISFTVPGLDFNADLHNPVETIGTIDNLGFLALVRDLGFGLRRADGEADVVVIAEQKSPVTPGGLQSLYNGWKDGPSIDAPRGMPRVNHFIENGIRGLLRLQSSHPEKFAAAKKYLLNEQGEIYPHYAYLAGRFGTAHVCDHLHRRAFHHLLCAQHDGGKPFLGDPGPFADVQIVKHEPGSIIIRKGTTYQEAKSEGSDRFYLVVDGSVEVQTPKGPVELKKGVPFGEILFLMGMPRRADVVAGKNGVTLAAISEADFWGAYKHIPSFGMRVDTHGKVRVKDS